MAALHHVVPLHGHSGRSLLHVLEPDQPVGPGQTGVETEVHESVHRVQGRHEPVAHARAARVGVELGHRHGEAMALWCVVEQVEVDLHHRAVGCGDVHLTHHRAPQLVPVAVEEASAEAFERLEGRAEPAGCHEQVEVGVGPQVGTVVDHLGQHRTLRHQPRRAQVVEGSADEGEVGQGAQVDEPGLVVVVAHLGHQAGVCRGACRKAVVDPASDAVERGGSRKGTQVGAANEVVEPRRWPADRSQEDAADRSGATDHAAFASTRVSSNSAAAPSEEYSRRQARAPVARRPASSKAASGRL